VLAPEVIERTSPTRGNAGVSRQRAPAITTIVVAIMMAVPSAICLAVPDAISLAVPDAIS
jgi:hypothetical protein